jgi:hypothetical protein
VGGPLSTPYNSGCRPDGDLQEVLALPGCGWFSVVVTKLGTTGTIDLTGQWRPTEGKNRVDLNQNEDGHWGGSRNSSSQNTCL